MKREDIIAMAQEAGFALTDLNPVKLGEYLERFAALVAASEREECAKVCMGVDLAGLNDRPVMQVFTAQMLAACAAAIRARGRDEHTH